MSKKRSKSRQPRSDTKPRGPAGAGRKKRKSSGGAQSKPSTWLSAAAIRELVESVVIAFVLAFLFRTFEAEAFVIPTGSMAPTLMGRHKDLVCEKCGYRFQASASDEVDPGSGKSNGSHVLTCTCPMCRFTMEVGPDLSDGESHPSYKGDRILVSKFPYQFGDPNRWDVAVFKYPGGAKTNFIKRIVGKPNETILISHGDIFTKPLAEEDFVVPPINYPKPFPAEFLKQFTIAGKSSHKLRAILQPVYNNDYVLPEMIEAGWPARWQPIGVGTGDGWASADLKSFQTDGTAKDTVWLGYQHFVPTSEDWEFLKDGSMPPANPNPRPQLITDFSAYNTDVVRSGKSYRGTSGYYYYGDDSSQDVAPPPSADKFGLHWVGDLAMECDLDVKSTDGEVLLELVEGGRIFGCRIDVATGRATLSIDGVDAYRPTAQTRVRGPGSHRILFANVDDQLRLWVRGRLVRFDNETTYGRLQNTVPTSADLQPARIGSRGTNLTVSHLKLCRDIYYIAERPGVEGLGSGGGPISDFDQWPRSRKDAARILSDEREWSRFSRMRQVIFPLRDDQFLVLGDNSAESKDSRLWECEAFEYYVSRDLLIGKALFIYWPHSLDKIPGTNIPIRFFPNFWRMWFVR